MSVALPCICKKANALLASLLSSVCACRTGLRLETSDSRCMVDAILAAPISLDVCPCMGVDATETARPKYFRIKAASEAAIVEADEPYAMPD